MQCILRPLYGDMDIVILGSNVEGAKKKLRKHWSDQLNHPDMYYDDYISSIRSVLDRDYDGMGELVEYYNANVDEDYTMEGTM